MAGSVAGAERPAGVRHRRAVDRSGERGGGVGGGAAGPRRIVSDRTHRGRASVVGSGGCHLVGCRAVPSSCSAQHSLPARRAGGAAWGSQARIGGGGGGDMEGFQLAGGAYLQKLGIITTTEFETQTDKVIKSITNPRGGYGSYHDHGGWPEEAIDVGYEGIWITYLTWAARASDYDGVRDALVRSSKMKAYITLPDPSTETGQIPTTYGPTHFNTGSAQGPQNDQWGYSRREYEAAHVTDIAKYLVFGWRKNPGAPWYPQTTLPDISQIKSDLQYVIRSRNRTTDPWTFIGPDSQVPLTYWEKHWVTPLPTHVLHPIPGFYDSSLSGPYQPPRFGGEPVGRDNWR